jgi:hypothetical protein
MRNFVVAPVFLISLALAAAGLAMFGGTAFGFGLTFGGSILAYESVVVFRFCNRLERAAEEQKTMPSALVH